MIATQLRAVFMPGTVAATATIAAVAGKRNHMSPTAANGIGIGLAIDNAVEADGVFSMLMGDDVPPRRQFIETHAKYARLDV